MPLVDPRPETRPETCTETCTDRPVIAVVVPCYRETAHVLDVLAAIGPEVGHIVVVDDACPDRTGDHVRTHGTDPRIEVVVHAANRGVGGATLSGYRRAIELGADVLVKMDGDGQMDPAHIPALVAPVLAGEADYAKGNRFARLDAIGRMPLVRILGNLALSFLSKMSSGYWDVFDPTNGFTALHAKVARLLPMERISPGFFFESDMLFRLGLLGAVVVDVPMPARYGTETSSLSIRKVVVEFAAKHAGNTARRMLFTYFLKQFSPASLELVMGTLLLVFGIAHGAVNWSRSIETGVPATAGTVLLAALPVILGVQFLLAFLAADVRGVPKTPLWPRL